MDKKEVPTYLPPKLIDLLFLRMEAIFGQSWSTRHTSKEAWIIAREEWAESLAKYTHNTEIIKNAINYIKDNPKPFPPNLGEFLDICKRFCPADMKGNFFEASPEFLSRYYGDKKKGAD